MHATVSERPLEALPAVLILVSIVTLKSFLQARGEKILFVELRSYCQTNQNLDRLVKIREISIIRKLQYYQQSQSRSIQKLYYTGKIVQRFFPSTSFTWCYIPHPLSLWVMCGWCSVFLRKNGGTGYSETSAFWGISRRVVFGLGTATFLVLSIFGGCCCFLCVLK